MVRAFTHVFELRHIFVEPLTISDDCGKRAAESPKDDHTSAPLL
jgi:hypothetical protein